uniref:BHLH domain-containing protein n=1 Tax=Panagrellus redivivus TaxID=6233 RepID=A0A7E4VJT1_PANRE
MMDANGWGPVPTDWATSSVSGVLQCDAQVVCATVPMAQSGHTVSSKPPKLPTSLAARQRCVAQQRRRLETEEFARLGAALPISRAISEQHIDKTSVVRLAASYIRLHQLLGGGYADRGPAPAPGDLLDGFMIVLTENGTILYVSESISLHLGLSQVDMIGNHLDGYLHPEDDVNRFIRSALFEADGGGVTTLRFKSTLTKRSSRDVQRPNAGFKSLSANANACRRSGHVASYLAIYCQPHLTALGPTLRLNNDIFVLMTDPAFGIVYIDPRYHALANRNPTLPEPNATLPSKQTTLYQWIYPDDAYIAADMHIKCKSKFLKQI